MKLIFLLLVQILLFTPIAQSQEQTPLEEKIAQLEAELGHLREELHIPGMSVAVLHHQEIVYARGFGYANLENEIAATQNTAYPIASLTKPIAATLFMTLVEADALDLEQLMTDAIPLYSRLCEAWHEVDELQRFVENYHCMMEPITIRHHLTHTAEGIPGEAFHYNGFVYGMTALVLYDATEFPDQFPDFFIPFEERLAQTILEPLEMNQTITYITNINRPQVMANLARLYQVDANGRPQVLPPYVLQNTNAGSGLISTVLDLARFDVAIDRNTIISEASRNLMFTPTLSNSGDPLPYGLGWFVQEINGTTVIWHYGHLDNNEASGLWIKIPQQELSFILLANSGAASDTFDLGEGDLLRSPFATAFLNIFD